MHHGPLAYFITWSCYGTWLPGDRRGWKKWHKGERLPEPKLATWVRKRMTETPVNLDCSQRHAVREAIAECCRRRDWKLHAANCRSNHCHVVVTAGSYDGESARDQLKSWSTRCLRKIELESGLKVSELRRQWWSSKGSVRHVDNLESLEAAIVYTNDAQDAGGSQQNT
jgi:REP element-mobilizing transposase RayT